MTTVRKIPVIMIICLMGFTGTKALQGPTLVSVVSVNSSSALSFQNLEDSEDISTNTTECNHVSQATIMSYLSNINVKAIEASVQVNWISAEADSSYEDAIEAREFLIWLFVIYDPNIDSSGKFSGLVIDVPSTFVFQAPTPSISGFLTCYLI